MRECDLKVTIKIKITIHLSNVKQCEIHIGLKIMREWNSKEGEKEV